MKRDMPRGDLLLWYSVIDKLPSKTPNTHVDVVVGVMKEQNAAKDKCCAGATSTYVDNRKSEGAKPLIS